MLSQLSDINRDDVETDVLAVSAVPPPHPPASSSSFKERKRRRSYQVPHSLLLGRETQDLAELLVSWVFHGMAGMEPVSSLLAFGTSPKPFISRGQSECL